MVTMILKIGQKVWAPKVAGVPAHKPENNVYELVGAVDEEEGSHEGYELKHDGHIFFAETGTVRHLQDVQVCKQCGSDKIQFPMWVDNLQVVHDACEGLDPFCLECNETITRSFHCTLDEYLTLQQVVQEQIDNELQKAHESLEGQTIMPKEEAEEGMDIYSPKGIQVKVTERTAKNGYTTDEEKVKRLVLNKPYTVKETVVHGFSTEVYLEEFPNVSFNSVNFVKAK